MDGEKLKLQIGANIAACRKQAGMTQAELAEKIKKAALALPQTQREVIYLKQYMTFREAAEMLNRPLGTVLADHHRGIQKMKQLLQKEAAV